MCTAATYRTKDFYFGRTLDYEFSYGEEITVTPRNYPFSFRYLPEKREHYAIIGMAHVEEDYPLYYDAVNEKGLGMAGLNFVGNAVYGEVREGKENVAVFELIPYILSQCENTEEARELLGKIQITDTRFKEQLPNGRLHWIIADEKEAITVESVTEGLKIYENAPGVLTNNPPFPMQMFQLNNYMQLSSRQPENLFSDQLLSDVQSSFLTAYRIAGITDVPASSHIIGMQDIKAKYLSCLILCYAAVSLLRKKFSAAFFCQYLQLGKCNAILHYFIPDFHHGRDVLFPVLSDLYFFHSIHCLCFISFCVYSAGSSPYAFCNRICSSSSMG